MSYRVLCILRRTGIVLLVLIGSAQSASPAEIEQSRELAATGQYEGCLEAIGESTSVYLEAWPVLKAEVEMTLGRWGDAKATLDEALKRHNWSIRLHWMARDAARRTGDEAGAKQHLADIGRLVDTAPWRFTDASNLVTVGEVLLEAGYDPKDVLASFFERAQRSNPGHREPVLAIGRLALKKRDFALAASTFREGLKQHPDDVDLLQGLALALQESDAEKAAEVLEAALKRNPRHIPSLLMVADRQIDAEQYDDARKTLDTIISINPTHDEAHALLAVLAHLDNDESQRETYREQALSTWEGNPLVDHVIGRKLSQKYRFAEGIEYQWAALSKDATYLPARKQAANDLLRLGVEDEGWKLVDSIAKDDQYDVEAYNLVTLRDELQQFTTLEGDDILVRMDAREASLYGQQVLELLQRAKATLCEKYGLNLTEQVIVEIFPNPADFEVRTFGMPGIPGFLGVCFGKVITANSPASQGASPSNWEAVLWHEFCHVVTLTLTRNRMPRWLSEGISVYEERQKDPRWGQVMTPTYRKLILDGELTPIGELSSAFLNAKSPLHVQFAYYESSLVVEFLIAQYGFDSLKAVLGDLAEGLTINEALPRHTAPLEVLDTQFVEFVNQRVVQMAPEADWAEPDLIPLLTEDDPRASLRAWIDEHPHNYPGLMMYAKFLLEQNTLQEAAEILQRMIDLYPDVRGSESPYVELAAVYRKLGDTTKEQETLERCAAVDADAAAVYLRLIELAGTTDDMDSLRRNAERLMAVNPLLAQPHEVLARVSAAQDDHALAADSYRALLVLEPDDPAEVHFRLAEQLDHLEKWPESKRHVLRALEYAPRFRDAHRLLLKIREHAPAESGSDDAPEKKVDIR